MRILNSAMRSNFAGMEALLAIESSCDDTGAAVLVDGQVRSNIVSSQLQHSDHGGVVPELASRMHTEAIVAVVEQALQTAGVQRKDLSAVAYTNGPGLLGALLVGSSFAKAFALGLGIPMIAVNHMHGHLLSVFGADAVPPFPFLALTVSGGHTQLAIVNDYLSHDILGGTIDDAAGEAFDKIGRMLELPYPGGPHLDQLAEDGDDTLFTFPEPKPKGYQFSFSGLKTSVLYFLRDQLKANPDFLSTHRADVAAGVRKLIVQYVLNKTFKAAREHQIGHIAVVGGVSANRLLRRELVRMGDARGIQTYVPPFEFCTDNAAMIGIVGWQLYKAGHVSAHDVKPFPAGSGV